MDAVLPAGIISGHHVIAACQFHQCRKLCNQVIFLTFHAASDRILCPQNFRICFQYTQIQRSLYQPRHICAHRLYAVGSRLQKAATRFVASGAAQVIVSAVSANLLRLPLRPDPWWQVRHPVLLPKLLPAALSFPHLFLYYDDCFRLSGDGIVCQSSVRRYQSYRHFSDSFHRSLPRIQLELPLSLCISPPECPPKRPETSTS